MEDSYLQHFINSIKPNHDFSEETVPKKPDYSDMSNWAAVPFKDGPQFLIPTNQFTLSKKNNEVDVFYIHPTSFFENTWNFDMNKNSSTYERTEIVLGNQASAFNGSCNIFAPEYRQATYYSFFDTSANCFSSQDLAYSDVESAFDYYIENFNHGRPFIIAGHSQGALHAQRLIYSKIQNTKLQNQLVCSYIIGYLIPEKYFDHTFVNIKRSESFNDTNSIISWCTVVEGFRRNRETTIYWTPEGWKVEPMVQKIVSVNPITWNKSPEWHDNDLDTNSIINKSRSYNFADRTSKTHSGCEKKIALTKLQNFSAFINQESGLIETKGPLIESMKKMKFFNGDLHDFDMMIFWGLLRKNIKDRIKAFI